MIGHGLSAGLAKDSARTPALIQQLFTMAGQVLITPISAAAVILLYYDLRIRKEGFDLEMLAADLSGGSTGAFRVIDAGGTPPGPAGKGS